MSNSLSPEQKIAVKSLLSNKAVDIKYFDLNAAFSVVSSSIISSIQDNKKVLIQTAKDDDTQNVLNYLLKQYQLDQLTIDIGSRMPIPEADIITLRSVLKKQVNTAPIIDQIINKEKLEKTLQDSYRYYDALDKTIFSDRTFRAFSNSLIYQQSGNNGEDPQISDVDFEYDLDFSKQEYIDLKKSILNASRLYLKEYDLLDNLDLLSDVVWTYSANDFEGLRDNLKTILDQSTVLSSEYKDTYSSLSQEATSQIDNEFSDLNQAIDSYYKECTSYHINSIYTTPKSDNRFSLFGKKTPQIDNAVYIKAYDYITGIIKELSPNWFENLTSPTSEEINYEFIINFIQSTKADIPKHQLSQKKNLNKAIHRVNRINTKSEAVKTLDKRLNQLIAQIDSMGFMNHQFNENTLSFVKQMELVQKISRSISQCYDLIGTDTEYTHWKMSERSNSPLTTHLINVLKKFPNTKWEQYFDNWYHDKIQSNILSDHTIDNNVINNLSELNSQINQNEISATINKMHLQRISASEELKSTSKDLYNNLFKKKTINPISWSDISLTSRSFLQEFFPIHIDNKTTYSTDYDLVISFNARPEIMNEGSTVNHLSPITAEDLEGRSSSDVLFLYLNSYQYEKPLSTLPKTEKLKASKKLAKYILSLNQQVRIYQIKSANIISLLPVNDDMYFEREMDQYGIKSIDTAGTLYDKLTESILFTNRQPFLLIKDELINAELHQHLLWQAELLQTFKSAGYKVLSFNTCDQLENNKQAFQSIINQIIVPSTLEKTATERKESTITPISEIQHEAPAITPQNT